MPVTQTLTLFRCIVRTPFLILLLLAGCDRQVDNQTSDSPNVLRLATTTSTRDSGLLDHLVPEFERKHNCHVDVVAVGTGAALKLGEAGDADVILVHARDAEEQFMRAGHGVRHEEFMENEFLVLGPNADPASIHGTSPGEAFGRIAAGEYSFVSRGDDSGTHKREQAIWDEAGGLTPWKGYIESGQGMGPTLIMADELQAYVLVDRGTFLRFQSKIDLVASVSGSPLLRNPYAVIAVHPERHRGVNGTLANEFIEFLIVPKTQQGIAAYRVNGERLFSPTHLPGE